MLKPRLDISLRNQNRLKIGLFGANCRDGLAVTTLPQRWDGSWLHNEQLAVAADGLGLEFLLPIARWRGYGGETDHNGASWETITWAAGLLAKTSQITVFATVHTPHVHPVFAAKQMVTVDHLSRGRFGLNIVCGWLTDEFAMFGGNLREQEKRYRHGQEWIDIVEKVWSSDEPFDFDGEFFTLRSVIGAPKPFGGSRPVLMNAGQSSDGRDFAARNVDFLFTMISSLAAAGAEVPQEFQERGRALGRDVAAYAVVLIVCRPSRREAEEFHHFYSVEHRDVVAVESVTRRNPAIDADRWAGGHGGIPLVGDPDDVANALARISDLGFGGIAVTFFDYLGDLAYFAQEVLPRLEARGLRRPWL